MDISVLPGRSVRAFVVLSAALFVSLCTLPVFASTYPKPFLPPIIIPEYVMAASRVLIADYNGDGRNDVIMSSDVTTSANEPSDLYIYLQGPDGALQPPLVKSIPFAPSWISAGDLNGDGRLDIVVVGYQSVAILYQDTQGNLPSATTLPVTETNSAAVADVNGDGRADLLLQRGVSLYQQAYVDVYAQNADGSLAAPVEYPTPSATMMAVGDVTSDGLPDVVLANSPVGPALDFWVLPQLQDHTFATAVASGSSGNAGGSIALGDINGDKHNDVVSTLWKQGNNHIDIALQSGGGPYGAPIPYSVTANPTSLQLGDFDGDGRLDIALAVDGYGEIAVYLQQPDGSFGPQLLYPMPVINGTPAVPYTSQGIAVGDINGDGKSDIVVADYMEGLGVLYNSMGTWPTNDLSVILTDSSGPFVVDRPANMALVITNAGPSDATGVVVADALPTSFVYQSSDHPCDASSGVITCSVGTIPAQGSVAINISAKPTTAVPLYSNDLNAFINTAWVYGNEIDYAQDNNTLQTRISATNPSPGVIQFSATKYTVSEGTGAVLAQIDVTRTNGLGTEQVWWSTGGVTATPGIDFQAASGALTWGDGDNTTKSFFVEILQDNNVSEPPKTIALGLEPPSVGILGANHTATLIIDEEATPVPVGEQSNGGASSGSSGGGGGVTDYLTMLLLCMMICKRRSLSALRFESLHVLPHGG